MRPVGRIWTKAVAAVIAGAAIGVGNARADDSVPTVEIGVEIQNEVSSEVESAVAVAVEATSEPVVVAMEADPTTVAVTAATGPETGGAAPSAVAPAPRTSEHPRKSRPRAGPQVRGRRPPRARPAAAPELTPYRAPAVLDSPQGTPAAPGRPHKPAAPAPRAPVPPSAPAPDNPGISWSGQGAGQGASLQAFAAAVAALLTLAFPLVLRRVIWWAQPAPSRIALPPWRPG